MATLCLSQIHDNSSNAGSLTSQTTLNSFIQETNAHQREYLVRKFQLFHYLDCKLFKNDEKLVNFEKAYHNVDLGNSYNDKKSGTEIFKYISKSKHIKIITEPFNNNDVQHNDVLFHGGKQTYFYLIP